MKRRYVVRWLLVIVLMIESVVTETRNNGNRVFRYVGKGGIILIRYRKISVRRQD